MDEHVHTEQRATAPTTPNPGNVADVTNSGAPSPHTPEYEKDLAEVVYPAMRATWELKPADAARMLQEAGLNLTAVQIGRLRWQMEKQANPSTTTPKPEVAAEPAQGQFAYGEAGTNEEAELDDDDDDDDDDDEVEDTEDDEDDNEDDEDDEGETAAAQNEKKPHGSMTKFVISLPANMDVHEAVKQARAAGYASCTAPTVKSIRYRYGISPAGKRAIEKNARYAAPQPQPQPRNRAVPTPVPPVQTSPVSRPRDDRERDRDALRVLILQVGMTLAAEVFEEMEHIASSIANR